MNNTIIKSDFDYSKSSEIIETNIENHTETNIENQRDFDIMMMKLPWIRDVMYYGMTRVVDLVNRKITTEDEWWEIDEDEFISILQGYIDEGTILFPNLYRKYKDTGKIVLQSEEGEVMIMRRERWDQLTEEAKKEGMLDYFERTGLVNYPDDEDNLQASGLMGSQPDNKVTK